jgi:hypothetical protein
VDKAAGREENVPTGEEEEDTEHWKKYASEECWGRYEKDKKEETEANPSGRHDGPSGRLSENSEIIGNPCDPSGRKITASDRLGATHNGNFTPCSNDQVFKPSSSSAFNNEESLPLGKEFGQLSLDPDFERQDYNKRKKRGKEVTFEQNKEDEGSSQLPYADIPRRNNLSVPPINVTTSPVPLPFPQAPRKEELQKKNNRYRREFIELFKKVNINIPLLDAIKQFPPYAKFLKELCTNKRKFTKDEQITLSEEVSAVLLGKLPPKLKDPGSFTVPCTIGNKGFEGAMLDLGASINLMPYHIYKTLSLDDIKPLNIVLKMADQRKVTPRGVVENILVKIDELLIPADFVVLDIKEGAIGDENEAPIILGRPFMATAGTKIDVQKGILTMTVFDTTVGFRIFDAIRSPMPLGECFRIDECVQPSLNLNTSMELSDGEEDIKQHPPSSEVKEGTNDVADKVNEKKKKKKKKKKKNAWLPLPTTTKSILKGFRTCFGGENHGESSSPDNGKKVCFEPP